ncbi:matrix extracellular phosphoglycoprotein [Octodon degus]|uniref:Matrix extracellular phosphoglycoprotein n=1 Tax=Octodon degus TaxID=10160 RepID=A0A6P6E9E5_OCTDE|nr:matrix extracellular phosphoglycoprotein [Octodon degus]
MQVVYVRLLLFSVTWAATTFQPQTVNTRRGQVEGQRQEEKSKGHIALHHFDKRRNQELSYHENSVLENEKVVSIFEANGNSQSSKSPHLSANRKTRKEEYRVIGKGKAHEDRVVPMYPESTGPKGAADGGNSARSPVVQEGYDTALVRNKMQSVRRPMTVTEQWEEDKDKSPRNIPRKIPADVNYANAHSKGKKSHQPVARAQNSPVKGKSTWRIRRSTHYLPQLSKVRRIPSDFEGSGYTDLQGRGDSDSSPFSGDGQPFKDVLRKGEAGGPDLKSTDRQTGLLGLSETEPINADTRGLGPNEIPEGEEGGDHGLTARAETVKETGEGSSDITGSTNFRDLPGKEGNRVDTSSQNAHRGKIELHYPGVPLQGQTKGGSGVSTESATHNEIPRHGTGATRKATELSGRNQVTLSEKHQFSGKGESQGLIIPFHGLDNEVSSHYGPHNEGSRITHRRKTPYVSHGQNDTVPGKGGPQRRGSWAYRRTHSHRGFSSPRRGDSSESSDSSSSSESGGH